MPNSINVSLPEPRKQLLHQLFSLKTQSNRF